MKILFLSTWFPDPPDNGSKIRVYHLLRALGARHQVTLLSFASEAASPGGDNGVRSFCEDIRVIRRDPFRRSHAARALRFLSPGPIVTAPLPEMQRAVRKVFTENAFDRVIASTEVMATYALSTPRTTVRILEEHNSFTRWMWERYQGQTALLQRLRCWASWQKTRHYEARLFRRFDLCTMVSEQDRQASLETLPGYRGRVEVVPNGVDGERNHMGLADPRPYTLIYNGALTYSANYDAMRYFLSDIYPILRQREPQVSLTITGSTAGVDLDLLHLDGSVRLSGHVGDIRPLVAGAWACVVPVRRGGGTRLKILEAMALGTPVVATTKGAEGLDVVPDRDILIADEPADFAAQVLCLLRDPNLRQHLATNARRRVEQRYDWAHIGRRFVNLVQETSGRYTQGSCDDR